MSIKNIGVIVGSARRESYCMAVAKAVSALMPEGFHMKMVKIDHLPLFNQDFDDDGNTPPEYTAFRKEISDFDGFLFVTPEYNRSFSAVLKNALDIASRPHGQNVWSGKPGAIISASPSKIGAFGANHHLRQVMTCLNVPIMQHPEAYIGNVDSMFDSAGNVKDDRTSAYLESISVAFAQWVNRLAEKTEKEVKT